MAKSRPALAVLDEHIYEAMTLYLRSMSLINADQIVIGLVASETTPTFTAYLGEHE